MVNASCSARSMVVMNGPSSHLCQVLTAMFGITIDADVIFEVPFAPTIIFHPTIGTTSKDLGFQSNWPACSVTFTLLLLFYICVHAIPSFILTPDIFLISEMDLSMELNNKWVPMFRSFHSREF